MFETCPMFEIVGAWLPGRSTSAVTAPTTRTRMTIIVTAMTFPRPFPPSFGAGSAEANAAALVAWRYLWVVADLLRNRYFLSLGFVMINWRQNFAFFPASFTFTSEITSSILHLS